MMNSLIYLELAKQFNRDRSDEADARRRYEQARRQRPARRPSRIAAVVRGLPWSPVRQTAPSPMGCTA